ncbi:hypothetical protein RKD49_002160 [Streptomyces glaucescens]
MSPPGRRQPEQRGVRRPQPHRQQAGPVALQDERAVRAVLAQQQPDLLPIAVGQMPYGDPGAVGVVRDHPFRAPGVVVGPPLHQDVRHAEPGRPGPRPGRAARGDQQAVDAVGEHPLGLGPLLLGVVLRDAEDEPDAACGGGLPGALDDLGVVVVGGRHDEPEDRLPPAPAGGRRGCGRFPARGLRAVLGQHRAAVHPGDEAALGQCLDVPAHGDGGDVQLRGDVRDPDRPALAQPVENLLVPLFGVHVTGLPSCCRPGRPGV